MSRQLGRTLIPLSCILALALPVVARAQQSAVPASPAATAKNSAGRANDEQAVRDVVARLIDAWNRHDAAAASAEMTEDVDMVAPPGMRMAGRAAIEAASPQMFATLYKDAHETATTDRIRFLGSNVALGDGTFTLVGPNFPGDARGLQTVVLVKTGGKWKLAALRRMIPTPPPPGAGAPAGN